MGFRAVVLCAGVGERLRPLTYKTNKSLLPIGEKTIIEHLLSDLAQTGVEVAHVVIGHYGYKFRKLLPSKIGGMKIQFLSNSLYKITGGAQSLYTASHILKNNPCLIVDGDHYLDPTLIKTLVESDYENCLLIDLKRALFLQYDEELVAYGYGGNVEKLAWKPPYPNSKPLGETLGLFKFSKDASASLAVVLEQYLLEDGPAKREYVEPFNRLMELHDTHYLDTDGRKWIDIDFVDDYEKAKEMTF